jgi:hypothetical protein
MKKRPYKRKPGDFEVRILADGRVVMVTPDEALLQIAQVLEPNNGKLSPVMEDRQICPTQDTQT